MRESVLLNFPASSVLHGMHKVWGVKLVRKHVTANLGLGLAVC